MSFLYTVSIGYGLRVPECLRLGVYNVDDNHRVTTWGNEGNALSPCCLYNTVLYGVGDNLPLVAFAHNDLTINDCDWAERVLMLFRDKPECVAVGFGGATGLGLPGMYREPYRIENMA